MKFIKEFWFPILIFLIVLTIIILFGDLSFLYKINSGKSKNNYKIYYLYDKESSPVSYEYKILELNKNYSLDRVVKEIIKKVSKNLPKDTKVISFKIENGNLTLNLSEDFIDNYPLDEDLFLLNIYSIVNTFSYLKEIDSVSFMVENKQINIDNTKIDFSKKFYNNINDFIVYSPLNNKLESFLYNDKNYSLRYINNNKEEYVFKEIKDTTKLAVNFDVYKKNENGDYKRVKEKWLVKNKLLYINDIVILSYDYKVRKTYEVENYKAFVDNKKYKATFLVKEVKKALDNSVIVLLEVFIDELSEGDNKYIEYIFLKQGYGIIKHEIIDKVNNYNYLYQLSDRKFIGDVK